MSRNIAIITARGGSKRIPKKNILSFCGKPIIAYSIEAALKSGVFDEVMVSTDSEEIAEIALSYGAKVPFMRSEATASDFATTRDVLLEVLERYHEKGIQFDNMCCIYPTAPFVTAEKLVHALHELEAHNAEQVTTVVSYSFPPQRCNVIDADGFLSYKFPENRYKRSQDLENWYHDAGQFYVYNIAKYLENDGRCTKIYPFILSELEVQDIDNMTDWKLAELKYQLMKEQSPK